MKKAILSAVLACAICFSALGQQRTVVSVNSSVRDGEIIPKELYGQFSEHLGSCIYGGLWVGEDSEIPNIDGYRKDVFEALKALKVPVMRWPGGCFADDYHWRDGIGPREKRAHISNNNWGGTLEDNSFGTHEFLNLCEMLGCEPYISGNVGSGTVEEMTKWIEYMTSDSKSTVAEERRANGREKPWKVKYFGIGNECWGCGGSMSPEYYVNEFKRYTTYTRNFSGNRLCKVASGASDYDYNWTKVLMEGIGQRMDAISLHYYSGGIGGKAATFDDNSYYATLSKCLDVENVIKRHIAIMDSYDPGNRIQLFLDEWGTWWEVEPGTNPGHLFQQNTMRDAMVAALSLNVFHKYTGRLKMANIAQVVNVLQSMILTRGDQMVLTPTYHVFEMYNVHQDARFVDVRYETGKHDVKGRGPVPTLSVTASTKDGILNVSLVNTDLKESEKVLIRWDEIPEAGFSAKQIKDLKASGRILAASDVHDFNDFGADPKVAPKEIKDLKVTKEGIEVNLPPVSVASVSIAL